MPFIGQAVVDRNAGVGSQLFNRFLLEAAELNGIKDLPEHTSRVLDAFLVTDLRRMGFKESGAGALVMRPYFKSTACAGGGLFKNKGDVFAFESLHFIAHALGLFKVNGEIDEIVDFSRRVVNEGKKAAAAKIHRHEKLLGSGFKELRNKTAGRIIQSISS